MQANTRSLGGRAAIALAATLALGACSGNVSSTAPGSGTMAVQLTDAPFSTDSVQSVDVFVVRIDARQADADSATAAKGTSDDSASVGGWTTLVAPNASVNLLAYQNGQALPLGQVTMPAGSYQGFRFIIDASRSSVTLKNGLVLSGSSSPGIMFPSAARSGIKIALTQPVTVAANATTTVMVDFNVGGSFVMRGSTLTQNGLLFTPVITATAH